jgi:hypothetical protein
LFGQFPVNLSVLSLNPSEFCSDETICTTCAPPGMDYVALRDHNIEFKRCANRHREAAAAADALSIVGY